MCPPICCAFPNGDEITAQGECRGTLAYAPRGENGFGYDPIFFIPEKKKTFAGADRAGEA